MTIIPKKQTVAMKAANLLLSQVFETERAEFAAVWAAAVAAQPVSTQIKPAVEELKPVEAPRPPVQTVGQPLEPDQPAVMSTMSVIHSHQPTVKIRNIVNNFDTEVFIVQADLEYVRGPQLSYEHEKEPYTIMYGPEALQT